MSVQWSSMMLFAVVDILDRHIAVAQQHGKAPVRGWGKRMGDKVIFEDIVANAWWGVED